MTARPFSSVVASVVALLCLAELAACSRKAPEPESRATAPTASAPVAPAAPAVAAPAPAGPVRKLAWIDPPGFERKPSSSPMRLATYRVPKAPGDAEDGELTVFNFGPGQGGSVASNLDRWEKQFTDLSKPSVRTDQEVNGLKVHVLEVERGTFSGSPPMAGGPAGPKLNYGMLAAIVETPGGSYFFKLSAPTKTVKAAKKPFQALVDSVGLAPG